VAAVPFRTGKMIGSFKPKLRHSGLVTKCADVDGNAPFGLRLPSTDTSFTLINRTKGDGKWIDPALRPAERGYT